MDQASLPARPGLGAELERADVKLGLRLASDRQAPSVRIASAIGELADQEPLYAAAAAVAAAGLATGRPRLFRLGASVGAAVLLADLAKSGLKRLVTRSRPHVLLDEGRYETGKGSGGDKTRQSFPSGHVAGAVAAAATVARFAPKSAPLGAAACLYLGWSRMSKGAHWPSDVVAGLIIGLAAAGCAAGLERCVLARLPTWARSDHQERSWPAR